MLADKYAHDIYAELSKLRYWSRWPVKLLHGATKQNKETHHFNGNETSLSNNGITMTQTEGHA
jgi:hypothetical protein